MNKITLFERGIEPTPIVRLSEHYGNNQIYVKREDLIPFSFGGNKARKAAEFYRKIKEQGADVVVTYGSNASNHCRIVANMAAAMGIDCHIISPDGHTEVLNNTYMVTQFGATIEYCPVEQVSKTIKNRMEAFRLEGRNPYFIMGGGHGNPGTEACVKAYNEIDAYETANNTAFDYIFHASGTGTTQAGLVCGKLLKRKAAGKIVGISIARKGVYGRQVVKDSIEEYLQDEFETVFREEELEFVDDYICGGYGKYTEEVETVIKNVMKWEGIPMDHTYVGKAFWGMLQYLEQHEIRNKNVLFIHTGGTPLYFDLLRK